MQDKLDIEIKICNNSNRKKYLHILLGATKMAIVKKGKGFILINCILPLLIGLLIYIFFRTNTPIHRVINGLLNYNFEAPFADINNCLFIDLLRYYLVDGLWCYALVFALVACTSRLTIKKTIAIGFIAFLSGAVFEVLQLKNIVNGTFDWADLCMYLIAATVAVWISIKHYEGKGEKE